MITDSDILNKLEELEDRINELECTQKSIPEVESKDLIQDTVIEMIDDEILRLGAESDGSIRIIADIEYVKCNNKSEEEYED